jgi:hypothetical protein
MRHVLMMLAGSLLLSAFSALPAGAATTTTYHFWSKQTSSKAFSAMGAPITRPSAAPSPGDYFISTDNEYVGDHRKHAQAVFGTDHIICTFVTVDPATTTFTALCDAQLALPGGMVVADRQTLAFTPNPLVVPITGGTGKYAGVKSGSSVTSITYAQNSDNSDLVVKIKR